MEQHIRGVSVQVAVQTVTGTDPFGNPEKTTVWETVENVLVSPATSEDINTALAPESAKIAYTLAIPKGDAHDWEHTRVRLPQPFGGEWKTVGVSTVGIAENIPLFWNRKVRVARCE